jgi:membrane associated rhomboid family serine protease
MFIPIYDDNPNDPKFYPFVTRGLVAINVIVFLLFQSELLYREAMAAVLGFGLIPVTVTHQISTGVDLIPPELTFVTYMFLHGGWMHLIGNMLFLWVFGDNVEHAMGRLRFLLFFLLCGIAGGFAHYLSMPDSNVPLVGASAAIAGVVAAYLMLFPHAKIWVLLLMRIPVRLSAKWILGAWIGFQFVSLFAAGPDDNTAWFAHIGGLAAGAVLVIFLRRRDVPLFARSVRTIKEVH